MFCGAVGNGRGEPYLPATYTEFGQAVGLALHEHFCTGKNGVLNGSVSARRPPPPPQSRSRHRSSVPPRRSARRRRAVWPPSRRRLC